VGISGHNNKPARLTEALPARPEKWRRVTAAGALYILQLATLTPAQASPPDICRPAEPDIEKLLSNESRCHKSPDFLHALGHLLNVAGRYSEALDRLESAMLLDPERWPVHLEYALALEGVGDNVSANGLLRQLVANPAVDPRIHEELLRILRRRQEALWQQPARRTQVGLSAGYDDNLLGVTRYANLQLSLPGGRLPVEIAEEDRPRGGSFLRAEITHEREFHQGADASWRYVLMGSYRWSIEHAPADTGHLGAGLERAPSGDNGWYSTVLAQQIYRGGRLALWQVQVGAGGVQSLALPGVYSCRLRFGGEMQATQYPGNREFDGRYAGILLNNTCVQSGWQFQLRAGRDAPVNDERPGGAQQQYALSLSRHMPFAGGGLRGEYEYYRQNDTKGYSSLLEDNARRQIQRHTYRMEYRWLQGGLQPYVGIEWLDQKANIPLFSPRNTILTIGVRHLW
jgi:tetratricopeptide (TPR) repeat protein